MTSETTVMNSMDIYEVMKHLPHRYPFLLIDRVIDYTPGETLTAIKNVTVNEPFFPGHFPHRPVFPGVLMLEAMAQATGILSFKTTEDLPSEDSLYYFAGIDKARFKKPIEPGDQIVMTVTLLKRKRNLWRFNAEATVDGKVVCSAELMCAKSGV